MRDRDQGSVLIVVVIVVLALAGLSSAFLTTTMRESASNSASEQRSRVLYIAESGVNDAVSEILAGGTGIIGSKSMPVGFGGGSYWVNTVDVGDGSYVVTSYAILNDQVQAIEVVLEPEDIPIFSKALFGDLDLGASGSVFTDSYDSAKGTYAEQATNYDETADRYYAEPEGDLGSNRNIILRGGVTVLGDAVPGPGYAVKISGTGVYVSGTTTPASAPSMLPPIDFSPPISATSSYSAVSDENDTITEGVYRFENMNVATKSVIRIQGDVVLYVDNHFDVSGLAQIIIEDDSSLTIYHNGDDFSLTGQGVLNSSQSPSAFKIFTTATTVKFSGTSEFYGAVYAPNGTITPVGTTEIYGSFVGRQVDVGGTADFHYDVALSRINEDKRTRLKRASWRRVPMADM